MIDALLPLLVQLVLVRLHLLRHVQVLGSRLRREHIKLVTEFVIHVLVTNRDYSALGTHRLALLARHHLLEREEADDRVLDAMEQRLLPRDRACHWRLVLVEWRFVQLRLEQ